MLNSKKLVLLCILTVFIYCLFVHNYIWKNTQLPSYATDFTTKRKIFPVFNFSSFVITKENDLINQYPPVFLPEYRNPCWLEDIHSAGVYLDNPYLHMSQSIQKEMIRLTTKWDKLLSKNNGTKLPQRLRCLPYFYIAGMPKSGTTDFYRRINTHPDIIKCQRKEPHWWTRIRFQELWRTNRSSFGHYIDLFDGAAEQIQKDKQHKKITSEASASTLWDNDFWTKLPGNANLSEPELLIANYIHHMTPKIKIIVILRNPADRLFSDYLYFGLYNKSLENFHHRVTESINMYEKCFKNETMRKCVYDRSLSLLSGVRLRIGLYWIYLQDWFSVFPKENFYIIKTEDYAKCLKCTFKKVYRFLGLPQLNRTNEAFMESIPKANTRRFKDTKMGKMWKETYELLEKFYQPHNERLVKLINKPDFDWFNL
uniref:N-acetylgalactosamine 4-sulfate 6-O-sulfotransferase n=1 Tax=Todarodes pacificus TaxID=6637 RepID=A8J2G2_TODPA|nr:N-acetylgalactosamine 4-sulfate 6-O-sulfotransferase [Todarodes pacificus]